MKNNGGIPLRQFGRTDELISCIGLGGGNLSRRHSDEATCTKLIQRAVDEGITFIDTADCYGDSEELVGRFLGHRMQECVIATKCGCLVKGDTGDDYTGPVVTNSIDRSLRRLAVDHLDLVLDPLGGRDWKRSWHLLAPTGRMVAFGFANMIGGQRRNLLRVARGRDDHRVQLALGLAMVRNPDGPRSRQCER